MSRLNLSMSLLILSCLALGARAQDKPSTTPPSSGAPGTSSDDSGFTNSSGLHFVPIPGYEVLFASFETRVKDYQPFIAATKRPWPKPDFVQASNHPAVCVSWEDAKAYAAWLTLQEHGSGKLPRDWKYRLPTDSEWSRAAGLAAPSPDGSAAADSTSEDSSRYPWGMDWPPPPSAGNYGPELAVDSFKYTSPVGSFSPNALGLYDLGGNAWEWCEDAYNQSPDYRVLRGASWRMRNAGDLLSSNRIGNLPDIHLSVYGFRLAIEKPPKPQPTPSPSPSKNTGKH